jgi:hypothetical protein
MANTEFCFCIWTILSTITIRVVLGTAFCRFRKWMGNTPTFRSRVSNTFTYIWILMSWIMGSTVTCYIFWIIIVSSWTRWNWSTLSFILVLHIVWRAITINVFWIFFIDFSTSLRLAFGKLIIISPALTIFSKFILPSLTETMRNIYV